MILKNVNNMIVALVLSVVVSGSMGAAFADQLYKTDEKQLSEYLNFRDHIVFVSESTAKILIERGYLIEPVNIELSTETSKITYDLDKRWNHTPELEASTGLGVFGTTPFYEIDLPLYVRVGENFTINIPYTFVKYDKNESDNKDDWEVDQIIEKIPGSELGNGEFGFSIGMSYPGNMVWLNPQKEFDINKSRNYDWNMDLFTIDKIYGYNLEPEHNVQFNFLLNDTMDYPYNSFRVQVFPIVEEYFVNYVGDGVYEISTEEVLPDWGPDGEPEPPCKFCPRPLPEGYEDPGSSPPLTKAEEMENIALGIRDFGDEWWDINDLYESLEDSLRTEFGDEWTDEFLKLYPEFVGRMILPMLDWSITEAHGQSSSILVRGSMEIEELPRRYVDPSVPLEVCAFDKNLKTGAYNALSQPNKRFGQDVPACDEIENGRFILTVRGIDPDNDRTTPDISVQILLKNEDIKLSSDVGASATIYQSETKNNPRSHVYFYGSDAVRISDNTSFFKPYKAFKTAQDTLTKFQNIGARNFSYLDVIYDPSESKRNPNVRYQGGDIFFANYDVSPRDRYITDYPVLISHEVGHFIQDSAYKHEKGSRGGTVGGCGSLGHNAHLVTNEKCAWSEGWATFVGLFANETPTYRTFLHHYTMDFESGTKDRTSFPTNKATSTEGWITAALWDIHDKVDETRGNPRTTTVYDRTDGLDRNLWTAFSTDRVRGDPKHVASDIGDFKADWDALGYSDISSIYRLNYISSSGTTTTSPSTNSAFSDNFVNLNKWTLSGDEDWDYNQPEERSVPRTPTPNTVAHADNCDDECVMTMRNSINLSSYNSAELVFWAFLDRSLDRNEGLTLEISTNGRTWTQLGTWTDNTNHDTDRWAEFKISLDSYLQNNVKLRFTAESSSSSEDVEIDNLVIKTT